MQIAQQVLAAQNTIFAKHEAYVKTLFDKPHPLRMKNGIDLLAKEGFSEPFDQMMESARKMLRSVSFTEYRRTFMPGDLNQVASTDNLYVACDNPKVFVVEKDLGELLRSTALKGADFEDLRLPFRTVYIKLPDNEFQVWMPNDMAPLEGVYVSEDRYEDEEAWLLFVMVSKQPTNRPLMDDVLFSMPIPFHPGPLEPQVEQRIEALKTRANLHPEGTWANVEQFPEVFRWVVNVVLYITSSGADLRRGWYDESAAKTMKGAKGNKKRNIRHTLEKTSSEVTWVGRTVRIDKTPKLADPGSATGDRRHPTLHWVRGFWRNQACGKGRLDRKHAWVRPFLRGEGRDVVDKMYVVGPKEGPCETTK